MELEMKSVSIGDKNGDIWISQDNGFVGLRSVVLSITQADLVCSMIQKVKEKIEKDILVASIKIAREKRDEEFAPTVRSTGVVTSTEGLQMCSDAIERGMHSQDCVQQNDEEAATPEDAEAFREELRRIKDGEFDPPC